MKINIPQTNNNPNIFPKGQQLYRDLLEFRGDNIGRPQSLLENLTEIVQPDEIGKDPITGAFFFRWQRNDKELYIDIPCNRDRYVYRIYEPATENSPGFRSGELKKPIHVFNIIFSIL